MTSLIKVSSLTISYHDAPVSYLIFCLTNLLDKKISWLTFHETLQYRYKPKHPIHIGI